MPFLSARYLALLIAGFVFLLSLWIARFRAGTAGGWRCRAAR